MCLNSVLNVKALVGAFNQEKALVGAFSVITNLRMQFGWSTTCYLGPAPVLTIQEEVAHY